MRIDIATLFPELVETVLSSSIIGRGRKKGAVEIHTHQIRDYALDKHRRTDDRLFGGGRGMLLQAEPICLCYEAVCEAAGSRPHVIYMSPQGRVLDEERAFQLSRKPHLFILCGHYEGVDERLLEAIVDEEISIGDYVLTGGEMPAVILIDAVARLCEGVLSDSSCFVEESHWDGLLEAPQYTQPAEWRGQKVPEVLLSGHHAEIAKYRRREAVRRTARKRPDMLARAELTETERALADGAIAEAEGEGAQNGSTENA